MKTDAGEYNIIEPFPLTIDGCDLCDCFKPIMYVYDQVINLEYRVCHDCLKDMEI